MTQYKPWQPQSVLITPTEVSQSIEEADNMGWYLAPSPINAAFIVMLAINKVTHENSFNN